MLLGIDPGRDKAGWALTDDEGTLRASGMFRVEEARAFFEALDPGSLQRLHSFVLEDISNGADVFTIDCILLGDGTGSEFFFSLAKTTSFRVKLVTEKMTTLMARELYWKAHPRRGIMRFVPTKFSAPPRDIDDFAAWAIVLNYCEARSRERPEGKGEG